MVQADASSGISVTLLQPRATYLVIGIGGQRASRKGALDGYRVWARDRHDLTLQAAAPSPVPSASAAPSATSDAKPSVSIAQALRRTDREVVIEATVTATTTLLDASGRRIVVQDATGAVEVLLPAGSARSVVGSRIRVEGKMGIGLRLAPAALDTRGPTRRRACDRAAPTVRRTDACPPVATGDGDWPHRRRSQAGRPLASRADRRWRPDPDRGSARCRDPGRSRDGRAHRVDHGHRARRVSVGGRQAGVDPAAIDRRTSTSDRSPAARRVTSSAPTSTGVSRSGGSDGSGGSGEAARRPPRVRAP